MVKGKENLQCDVGNESLKAAKSFAPFAVNFMDHVTVVVIPQGATKLLVIHGGFVLPPPPLLCHQLWIIQLELAVLPHPHDEMPTPAVRQQFQEKLPQLDLSVVTCHVSMRDTVEAR